MQAKVTDTDRDNDVRAFVHSRQTAFQIDASLQDILDRSPVSSVQFSSVQFSSARYGIYALGKAHMRSTVSLRSFPNAAFERVPMLV